MYFGLAGSNASLRSSFLTVHPFVDRLRYFGKSYFTLNVSLGQLVYRIIHKIKDQVSGFSVFVNNLPTSSRGLLGSSVVQTRSLSCLALVPTSGSLTIAAFKLTFKILP